MDAEANAKLERLIAATRSLAPSQIHRLDDDHVLVAIPLTSAQPARRAQVAVAATRSDDIPYKDITEVEVQHLAQAIRLSKTFEPAIDKQTLEMDLGKALELVQQNQTMTVVGTVNTTVVEHENKVEATVDKVLAILLEAFQLALSAPLKTALTAAVTNTFTNLATQEGGAWIFYQSSTSNNCTYVYNILFAVQNDKTGGVMLALPISYKITVNKDKKTVLFLTIKDVADYSVQIRGVRVAQILE
ncbi:hypothetical protein [Polyangium mundeleinium]|uniref:Uncharacterized protein n=1 Tax=Polyangium mundeleinium TaxID=2995306 RepID=A0ABT5EX78_9BACT|nr:hypothetical protein [Polyangium mundeleinium]MDC0746413.1 hypothetical protein [Polyangium mundeleinium]